MEKLIAAQRDMYGRIARSYDNLKKAGSAKITASSVRAALALLENKWAKFEAQHAQLRDAYGDELVNTEYVAEDLVDHAESTYLSQHSLLRELEKALSRESSSEAPAKPAVEHSFQGAFPRIDVPQFSGEFEDWPAFRDLFCSMVVEETALSKVRKLHYLKKSVRGEADRLIWNIPCTGDNFERAWDIILSHFENKRLLVRSYLSAFYALPRMRTDSLDDLRKIYHGAVTTATSLEGVGRPVDPHPDFFVHFLAELLDTKTRLAW